jgi:WD40 repeat protein
VFIGYLGEQMVCRTSLCAVALIICSRNYASEQWSDLSVRRNPLCFMLPLLSILVVLSAAGTPARDRPEVEIVPNLSHSSVVTGVAFSPDGILALSGSYDNTLKLWEVTTGKLLRTFQ